MTKEQIKIALEAVYEEWNEKTHRAMSDGDIKAAGEALGVARGVRLAMVTLLEDVVTPRNKPYVGKTGRKMPVKGGTRDQDRD